MEVTSDISLARVYWHGLPGVAEADPNAVQKAFERASKFLRAKVGEAITARVTPELRFIHDDALDRGRRIETILHRIAVDRPREPSPEAPSDVPNSPASPEPKVG
jgi:ribosome-binding factor A